MLAAMTYGRHDRKPFMYKKAKLAQLKHKKRKARLRAKQLALKAKRISR